MNEKLCKKVRLFTVLLSAFRHRWLIYFRPRYTIASLMKRKGSCKSCGRCCLLNVAWCPYFKEAKCQAYHRQPFFCRIFPIDKKDKKIGSVSKECGYYWEDEKTA